MHGWGPRAERRADLREKVYAQAIMLNSTILFDVAGTIGQQRREKHAPGNTGIRSNKCRDREQTLRTEGKNRGTEVGVLQNNQISQGGKGDSLEKAGGCEHPETSKGTGVTEATKVTTLGPPQTGNFAAMQLETSQGSKTRMKDQE